MKKIVLIVALYSFLPRLFAGGEDKNSTSIISPDPLCTTDTIPFTIDEDELLADDNDSLISFPSDNVYGSWDTLNIHPYRFNISQLDGTSTIPLCLAEWEDRLKKGDNIILTTFGAGFTWGGMYLKWSY